MKKKLNKQLGLLAWFRPAGWDRFLPPVQNPKPKKAWRSARSTYNPHHYAKTPLSGSVASVLTMRQKRPNSRIAGILFLMLQDLWRISVPLLRNLRTTLGSAVHFAGLTLGFLLSLACGTLAAPPQDLWHIQTCTAYIKEQTKALNNKQWDRLVTIARTYLTECKNLIDPDEEASALDMIVTGLIEQEKFADALPLSRRCIAIKPDAAYCYFDMGRAYEELGLDMIDNPYFDMRQASEALGQIQGALEAYRKAIDIGGYDSVNASAIEAAKERLSDLQPLRAKLQAVAESSKTPAVESSSLTQGTGFFVTDRGHILTNGHVVSECRIIRTTEGQPARLIDVDKGADLALLKTSATRAFPATLRTGRPLRIGDDVVAFGYPLKGLLSSGGNVSAGIISAISGVGDDPRFLQISAPVQPGNSGGPLFDSSGNVIGVVVAKLDAVKIAKMAGDIPQNVNFAVQGAEVIRFLEANLVPYRKKPSMTRLSAADIASIAKEISVAIECVK